MRFQYVIRMLAVLISGGLDSAILLGDVLRRGQKVQPLYVRCGLAWETVELTYLHRYLAALASPSLLPLTILEQPVADLYKGHWSLTGRDAPDARSPDEAVYLPGRNVLLLGKAMLWCHLQGLEKLALGTLASNPFPDASVQFFQAFQDVVNRAVKAQVQLHLPFANLKKKAVMALGKGLPLEWSFSCIQPREGLHCGHCNKCAERILAFKESELADPTPYWQGRHPGKK